jgi:hypothetical protein
MLGIDRPWHRPAVIVALCTAIALMMSVDAAAYPPGPDGEPLYLENGVAPASAVSVAHNGSGTTSLPSRVEAPPAPTPEPARHATERGAATVAVAASGLAALALVAATYVLNGYRRRSAGAH